MTNLQDNEVRSRTITAFFDTRASADKAVADLAAAGIPKQHITVTGSGTTAGATSVEGDKGFWDSLKDLFLPDEDRSVYAEGLRRGGFMVAVRSEEATYNRVLDILDQDGAVDLQQREASWRSEGWTGGVSGAQTTRSAGVASLAATTNLAASTSARTGQADLATGKQTTGTAVGHDEVIPVYEEQIQVGKRDVNRGRVRVRSYIVETPVNEQVSLHSESVQIDRRPVDRPVGAADVAFQDRVIEAEEHAEEAVIAKTARVKEEITLRKVADDRVQTVSDSVRRTEVEIEDNRGAVTGGARSLLDTSLIVEHMDVIGSDGAKIGTVDHLDGPDKIKLAKNTSPDGQHHYIPVSWIDHVDTHVHLKASSVEAKAGW